MCSLTGKKTVVVILLVFTAFSLFSQQVSISLDEAVSLALKNSKAVKEAEITYQTAINNSKVNSLMPSFSLGASIGPDGSVPLALSEIKTHFNSVAVSAGISWNLSSSDVIKKSTKELTLERARMAYVSTVYSVRSETELAYYSVASSQVAVQQTARSLEQAEDSLARTQAMYDASQVAETSPSQARLTASDSRLTLETAQDSLKTDSRALAKLIGYPEDTTEFLLDGLPDLSRIKTDRLREVVEHYYLQTNTVNSAQLALKIAENENFNNIVSNAVPKLSLSTRLSYSANGKDGLGGNVNFDNSPSYSATLGMSIPIDTYIPGTSANADFKNRKLNVESKRISLENAKDKLKKTAMNTVTAIEQALRKKENLAEHLVLATRNLELVREAWEAGFSSNTNLSNAQLDYDYAVISQLTNDFNIIERICSLASLLELDVSSVMEYIT